MRDLLTASRMGVLSTCPRKHYWRYEIGLKRVDEGAALRFGTAWHRSMEARAKGADVQAAFTAAVEDCRELNEIQLATLSGMLAGYYRYYENDAGVTVLPEVEFSGPMAGSRTFELAGKIDGLAALDDGRTILIEHKTTSADVSPVSDYWMRLRGNVQLMQYVLAARALGHDVANVVYDVARKPMIAPKAIAQVDAAGLKIVLDANGARVFKKDGAPRESGDAAKGFELSTLIETPAQFADRLAQDTVTRPEFYFARRDAPVLEDDLAEFIVHRSVLARLILSCRRESRAAKRPEHGWPRNVGEWTCKMCDFSGFCLQNAAIDAEHPPAGFCVGRVNPELSETVTPAGTPATGDAQ